MQGARSKRLGAGIPLAVAACCLAAGPVPAQQMPPKPANPAAASKVGRTTATDDVHMHQFYEHVWNGPAGGATLVMTNSARCTFAARAGQAPAPQPVNLASATLRFGGASVGNGACKLSVLGGTYLTNLDVRNPPAQAAFTSPTVPCTFTAHREADRSVTVTVQGQVSLPVAGAAPIVLAFQGRTTDAGTRLPLRFHMQSSPPPTYCPSLQPVANPDQTINLSDH